MRALDIAGVRYGQLVAIHPTRRKNQRVWVCRCACGTEVIAAANQLRAGNYQRCRACNRISSRISIKVGDVHGKWTVFRVFIRARTMVEARCSCGVEKEIVASVLVRGATKQCRACACRNNKHHMLPHGVAVRNRVISNYKERARRKGLSFELTDSQLTTLFSSDCSYCGSPPSLEAKTRRNNGGFVYTGIDRVDNTAGYVRNNVVAACSTCNYRKREAKPDEFLDWVFRVASHRLGMVIFGEDMDTKHSESSEKPCHLDIEKNPKF